MSISQQPRACRVLVTGADGFVGRWLIRALPSRLPSGAQIFAATNSHKQPGAGIEHLSMDITNPEQVIAGVLRSQPTCVIHLAAVSALGEARKDTIRTWEVNLKGT